VRTFNGTIPVEALRPPIGATLLSDLDAVTQVRFRAPLDIGVVSPGSFTATVDLSRVDPRPGGEAVDVPVTLTAINQLITIVDYQPQTVAVRLDPVSSRELPVNVSIVSAPDGLDLGVPQTDPSSVTIRGASSRVDSVTQVVARVSIDASGLNIDRNFDLIPLDANRNEVPNIELEPERARVRIAVARQLANRTLPVVPLITGAPAAGYRVASVTVEPLIVTVSGEASVVTQLETATTEQIDIAGRTDDLEASVRISLPSGASVSGSDAVRVVITIEEETGTRTFDVGVEIRNEEPPSVYSMVLSQVRVTVGGPISILQGMDASTLTAYVDVAGLGGGQATRPIQIDLPPGLTLIDISPPATPILRDESPVEEPTATPQAEST
jgi:YbbR domain-containing protein